MKRLRSKQKLHPAGSVDEKRNQSESDCCFRPSPIYSSWRSATSSNGIDRQPACFITGSVNESARISAATVSGCWPFLIAERTSSASASSGISSTNVWLIQTIYQNYEVNPTSNRTTAPEGNPGK